MKFFQPTIPKITSWFIIVLFYSSVFAQQTDSLNSLVINVKINEHLTTQLATRLSNDGHLKTGISLLDTLNHYFGATHMKRVFPDAGKYEAVHRKYGLHQWYQISFEGDTARKIETLIHAYSLTDLVDKAEPLYERELQVILPPETSDLKPEDTNDPRYKEQWHYHNTGQTGGSPGADISLPDAWQVTQGSDDVIVAIIDGGIEIDHEDLKDALWVNKREKNGANGVDDDGNGYIDDIYGYGFGDQTGNINPHYHGTHVAGTVGAVNENGMGVAGIAGGGKGAKGVQLMSCAVFGKYAKGGFPESFVYAADNGAVIAQNSWGGGGKSQVLEDAIDYFIARAGFDNSEENFEKNIQVGPMAGGIVIFAAGNDASSNPDRGYPSSYPPVMSVASTDHFDHKSSFSNYGDWVEISAPGSNVLSTYTNNSYNLLSGTSMACPHVSGVAALIVSKLGKQGFLPEQVWDILVNTPDDIDDINSNYKGMLGAGRLNAFQALYIDDETPPAAITDLAVDSVWFDHIRLKWTATGSDGSEGAARRYDLRYATHPITQGNFNQATAVTALPRPAVAGSPETWVVDGLTGNTRYYFAIKAFDLLENASEISNTAEGKTVQPPVMKITPDALEVHLKTGEKSNQKLTIDNTAGKSDLTYSLSIQPGSQQENQESISRPLISENRLPGEYTDTTPIAANHASDLYQSKVLVIQDTYAWGLNMADFLKDEFDITATLINASQIRETSFDDYDVIITVGDENGTYYANISNNLAKFESFIKNGGVVQYQLATQGSNVMVPGGVKVLYGYMGVNQVIKLHPITEGMAAGIYGESNLTCIVELPENAEILTETVSASNPTTAVYKLGAGEIIVTGIAWEWLYARNYDGKIMLPNATRYALENSHPWLEHEKESGVVAAGEKVDLNISFDASGLYGGIYKKSLIINGNDPDNASDTIPVTMHVTGAPDIVVSSDTLSFDTLYVNLTASKTLSISNEGTDTLKLSKIQSLSDAFQVKDTTFTLAPGDLQSIEVTFAPHAPGTLKSYLQLISNDPDDDTLQVVLSAVAIPSPTIKISPDSLDITLVTGEQTQYKITLSNAEGGSLLTWKSSIVYKYQTEEGKSQEPESQIDLYDEDGQLSGQAPLAYGDFHLPGSSLTNLNGLIVDPKTNLIYAQQYRGNQFFRFNPDNQRWSFLENAPLSPTSTLGCDGIYFQDKIYMVYSNNVNDLGIYDIATNTWSTISNELKVSTRNITADDQYLYLVGNEDFKRYDPGKDQWTTLAVPPLSFSTYSGLSYYDGVIYGHSNQKFAKYDIASDIWVSLPDLPVNVSIGSTIDLREGAYCTASDYYLLFYNFDEEGWSVSSNPYFNCNYGDVAYAGNKESNGIYIAAGSYVKSFGFYETLPVWKWMQMPVSSGSLEAKIEELLTIDFDAADLAPGDYQGDIKFQSNDAFQGQQTVSVTLHVVNIPVKENEPPQLTNPPAPVTLLTGQSIDSLRLGRIFTDPEGDILTYTVIVTDTSKIYVEIEDGMLAVSARQEGFSFIQISAKDEAGNIASGTVIVTVTSPPTVPNLPPDLTMHFADTTIEQYTNISLPLHDYFTDPEADTLTYTFTISDTDIFQGEIKDEILHISAQKAGMALIQITATDGAGNSTTGNMIVSVTLPPSIPNLPPEISAHLADTTLVQNTALLIPLSAYFIDSEDDTLTYSASSINAVVSVRIHQDTLILVGYAVGATQLEVAATDTQGNMKKQTFQLSVTPANRNPELYTLLADQTITLEDSLTVDLQSIFYDDDQDELRYMVQPADGEVASVRLDSSMLTIHPLQAGSTQILISADDAHGGTKETEFNLRVAILTATTNPIENDPLQIFPNPVSQSTKISYSITQPTKVTIQLLDSQGKVLETILEATQNPGPRQLDWHPKLHQPGIYFLTFTTNDQTLVRKVVIE